MTNHAKAQSSLYLAVQRAQGDMMLLRRAPDLCSLTVVPLTGEVKKRGAGAQLKCS